MTDSITVTGNIATEPEHKRTPAGVAITTFRVASAQRRYDRATNAWVDSGTNWYSVSTFRGLAEHAFHSLHKGDRVILTGRLKLREWDTGVKKGITADIEADSIGHDLLFGTTTFQRDATAAPAASASSSVDWSSGPSEGEWAVPGAPGSAELVLVGASPGAADDPALVADTPF